MTSYVVVNNSQELFGPMDSGAIATCIWEICRAAQVEDCRPLVLTQRQESKVYDWPDVRFLERRGDRSGRLGRIDHRLTGWQRSSQRAYAHAALAEIRSIRPEVVLCNNDPQIAAFLAGQLRDVTVVHWFHNLELVPDGWRRVFRRSGVRSVAVSRYLAKAIEMVYDLGHGAVQVAMNGVDAERFAPQPRTADDQLAIGFLGRVAVEKGVDDLLEAALLLASHRDDFRVEIAGDTNWGRSDPGSYRDKIDKLSGELMVRGIDVRRHGHVPRERVPLVAGGFDIQVVPSRWDEPFALTLLEGMALGLPIVATAAGGMPEVLGSAGVLVPREDPQVLAEALDRLLDDEPERKRLADAAQRRAMELSWSRTWHGLRAVED